MEVAIAPYRDRRPAWVVLGRTPLSACGCRAARSACACPRPGSRRSRWPASQPRQRYRLDPVGTVPPGMVRVGRRPAAGTARHRGDARRLLDRPARGHQPGVQGVRRSGRLPAARRCGGSRSSTPAARCPGSEAMAAVPRQDRPARTRDVDRRERYPAGRADYPVDGVSWYEAAAYAAFAGARLPTMHHWYRAAALGRFADILAVSNFERPGTGGRRQLRRAGALRHSGHGRQREGVVLDGRRRPARRCWAALGRPAIRFRALRRGPPLRARARHRTAPRAATTRPLSPAMEGPVRLDAVVRDGRTVRPVGDAVFAVMRRQYAYDRAPLNAVVEATERTERWVRVTVAFDAALRRRAAARASCSCRDERRAAVSERGLFPAGDAFQLRSSRDMSLVLGGLHRPQRPGAPLPGVQGHLRARDRRDSATRPARAAHRLVTASSDAPSTISRRGRTSTRRASASTASAPAPTPGTILTALEPRLKASVLQGTGIWGDETPENDAVDYAPRIRMPA